MDDGTGESSNFKKLEEGFRSFVVIEKKLLVLICSKFHSQSCYYLCTVKFFTSSQK